MRQPSRLTEISIVGAMALGSLFTWFFGNLFYDLFWAFLESHHVRQSEVIAWTLGHLTPFILAFTVVGIIYASIRYELKQSNDVVAPSIQHDMSISDAIDYIVN